MTLELIKPGVSVLDTRALLTPHVPQGGQLHGLGVIFLAHARCGIRFPLQAGYSPEQCGIVMIFSQAPCHREPCLLHTFERGPWSSTRGPTRKKGVEQEKCYLWGAQIFSVVKIAMSPLSRPKHGS